MSFWIQCDWCGVQVEMEATRKNRMLWDRGEMHGFYNRDGSHMGLAMCGECMDSQNFRWDRQRDQDQPDDDPPATAAQRRPVEVYVDDPESVVVKPISKPRRRLRSAG